MNNNEFWVNEKFTTPDFTYIGRVDKVPTTFEVDKIEYKLEFISTPNNPGGGKLYGLTSKSIADPYMPNSSSDTSVFSYLKNCSGQQRTSIKNFLIARQRGESAEIDVSLRQFSNGLHLLFCFEVSRRLAVKDPFIDLPILLSVPFLLENFLDLNLVQTYFTTIFTTKERRINLRKVIGSQKMSADGKALRIKLRMFHADDEDSGEDELENYS